MTRVAAVAEDGQGLNTAGLDSVREIFELAGFVFSKFGIYDTVITTSPEICAGATPRTGAVLDFLKAKLLTEVDGAIANLAVVTNTSFTSVIDPAAFSKTSGVTLTVDYADALVIKAFLQALKCNLELVMVYGLDVSIPSIQAAPDQLMTYKQFFHGPHLPHPERACPSDDRQNGTHQFHRHLQGGVPVPGGQIRVGPSPLCDRCTGNQ